MRSIGTYYLLLYALILTIISVNTAVSPVSTDTTLNINTNITFIPAYCPLCKYFSRVLDHAWLGTELQNKSRSFYRYYIIGKREEEVNQNDNLSPPSFCPDFYTFTKIGLWYFVFPGPGWPLKPDKSH